ncbi:MAG TPA: SNF2 helicase-associated domain-containing protein, partial [Candidatus Methanoperedens sp.]
MIVLHGTWKSPETLKDRGDFFLWGESSSISSSPVKRRGRPPKVDIRRMHPFQVTEKDLKRVIESLDSGHDGNIARRAHPDNMQFLLPSLSNSPQASPDLLIDDSAKSAEERVSLSKWKVEGLSIQAEDAVLMLSSLSGIWMENDSAVIGTDLRFWSKVSKFAMELLSKQHFVPGIVFSDSMAFARWQYVLNDENDRMRFSMLARSMPHVCRALVQDRIQNTRKAILSDFLNSAIDSCIRSWIPVSEMKSNKSISETWLQSLVTGEPIKVHASGLRNLSEGIQSWEAPIHEIEKSEFRTCFRLEPPEDMKSDWNLRYFLQASNDQSLLVPAENVWRESSDTLQFLNRKFDHPQEKLLADLGKASRLYSPIEDSLHSARPGAAQLTTQQAYTFLKEAVPLLTESGFGVLIPPWRNKDVGPKPGVKLSMKPKRDPKISKGTFGFDSIINYNWQLAIGNEPISEEEFEKLVNLKEPLVRIRGQWVEMKKEDIEAAIRFFKSRNSGEIRLGEALRLSLGHNEDAGLPLSGFEASGWLEELFERLSGRAAIKELPQPDDFIGKLRPYQVKGFSWLAFLHNYGLGACLADDMGLGKTIQMLALLLMDKEKGEDKPVLLICPTSVVGNWQREAKRFAPILLVLIHHGINRKKKKEFL